MKKVSLLVALVLIIVSLCSCGLLKNQSSANSSAQNQTSDGSSRATATTSTATQIPVVHLLQGGVYKNEQMGFQLTFPDSWKNYYIINQLSDECIQICFYGESKDYQYDPEYGYIAPLFYIGTEADYKRRGGGAAGGKKIGSVGTTNFYKFTNTDYPFGETSSILASNTGSKSELEKLQSDNNKGNEMEGQIDDVIKTFKSIR